MWYLYWRKYVTFSVPNIQEINVVCVYSYILNVYVQKWFIFIQQSRYSVSYFMAITSSPTL